MISLVILLIFTGIIYGAAKVMSGTWRFFAPTRGYIKWKIIKAIVKNTGISYNAANALWPFLVFAVIATLVVIVIK